MFLFSIVLIVVAVIEHRGWRSLKGEGSIIAQVKHACIKVKKRKNNTQGHGTLILS